MPNNNKTNKIGYSEKSSMPPLGIISIGSYLKIHGYEVKYMDLLSKKISKHHFEVFLNEYKPDIVGISTYTETYNNVIKLCQSIKMVLPKTIIVLGGPHVSFLPEESLVQPYIDFVIRGEGENTFVELIESLNFKTISVDKIKGLSYKINDRIINNIDRSYITKLDSLPWGELDEDQKINYAIKQLIITSRGCPGRCIYCASAALSGRKYRFRSAENVFSEIYYKHKYKGESYFAFLDDTFTANKKRLYKFCDYINKSKINIIWRCDSRADILTYEMVDKIKETGCIAIHIGIESGSQEVISQINKNINLQKAEDIIKYISKKGLDVMCSFIVGHHCDTHDSVKKTIELAKKFKKDYKAVVAISANTPFPGTEIYKNRDKLGIKLETKNWSSYDLVQVIISTKHLSRAELQNYLFDAQNENYGIESKGVS